jgi:protein SCO1/2
MDRVLNKLKKENKSLKLFFISVDPERDTSEVVKDYLNSFESNFIGITGKPEKIYLLSQSWGIFSQKIFKDDGKYNVDHSSPVILLKDGKYVARISHKDDIKKSIKIIKKYL